MRECPSILKNFPILSADSYIYLMLFITKKLLTCTLLILTGAIFLGIGILAFTDPFSSYLKLVKFSGIGLLINGAFLLVVSAVNTRYRRERLWMQAESVVHMLFGILFLFNPLLSFIALPYFIGPWIFIIGMLKILAALSLRKTLRGWTFIMGIGLLCAVFGILLLFSPFLRANDMTVLIGAFGVVIGALYIIDALRYRKMEETLDMML
jgi:uncharacterized membrane protein HdeD (DUF308 family)